MAQIDILFGQFKEWLDGSASFDALDEVVQKAIDTLIAEEDATVEKGDPTSSDVHVDGVNWKTPQKKKKGKLTLPDTELIHKANEEQRFTLGPWYIPNKGDAHNEWTDAEELQKALWDYVRSGDRDIRLQHNKDIVAGEWVEAMSFPVPVTLNMTKATGDAKEVTYPAGTVFLGVKWNDWAWDLVKSNKITGFSIGGSAARVEMGIPADTNQITKYSQQVAKNYVAQKSNTPAVVASIEEQLQEKIRSFVAGEPKSETVAEESPAIKMRIDGVVYDIVPLNKSYKGKVFNVAGLYGENGSVAVVRTDGERFWASGSSSLSGLPFEKAQLVFAEVAKAAKQTFGGNRSAAGQYAANVRWGRVAGDPKKISESARRGLKVSGEGPYGAATTEGGMVQETRFASMQTHCDFDALAADMQSQGLNPSVDEPDYATLRKHISPERAALHDKIMDSHFVNEDGTSKTPPAGDPEYVFMGGGPAAGKSSMLAQGAGPEWAGNGTNKSEKNSDGSVRSSGTDKHSVAINADEIKSELPPYQELVGNANTKGGVGVAGRVGQMTAASVVHEESSILAKGVNERAINGGFNVILDGTGDNSAKSMTGKIEKIRNARGPEGESHNYKVTGVYATVPTQMAVRRAQLRGLPVGKKYPKDGENPNDPSTWTGKGQGRYVNDSVVVGTHVGVSRVFPVVASQFDSTSLFDTSTFPPRMIMSGGKGKPPSITDQKAYDEFVAKG